MKKFIWYCTAFLLLACMTIMGCPAKSGGGGDTPSGGGHPGMDMVTGGTVMTSESYRLVLTTGQGPGGNGVMTSASYTLQGGLVGSTQ